MRRYFFSFLLAFFVGITVTTQAMAGLISGTTSPTSLNAPSNAPLTRSVVWQLNRNGAAGPTTVLSTQADILLNGTSIYTINKTLTKSINITLNVTPFVFSEVVTIPRSVITRALATGGTLTLRRVFEEPSTASTRTIDTPIIIGSPSTADFSVTRITLAFSNGSYSCLSKPGAPLKAIAQIEATGSGLFRGEWQVRRGGSLGSFRTLRAVQVPVRVGTDNRIESPELPLEDSDRLDVRLVVRSPVIGFTEPLLTCQVSGQPALTLDSPQGKPVELLEPEPHSPLHDSTILRWKPVAGTKVYRIEILTEENGLPVAVQLAKGSQTTAKPSPLTLEKLEPDVRYIVKVTAQ